MTFTLHDDLTFDEFAAYVREHLSYSDRKPVRTEKLRTIQQLIHRFTRLQSIFS